MMKSSFFFFLFLFLLFSSVDVSAIGISPPQIVDEFQPNSNNTYMYYIINTANPSFVDVDFFGSPLATFIHAEQTSFNLPQGTTALTFSLDLPSYNDIPDAYGKQVIRIKVRERPIGEGSFSAVTAVIGQLVINVPVPGEYGQVTAFDVPTVNEGLDTVAEVSIRNRGTIPLSNKRLEVEVVDVAGNTIDTQVIPSLAIPLDQERDFSITLPSSTYTPAKYTAVASFYFDEEKLPATLSQNFFVGSTDIQLVGYTSVLEEGKINKVQFTFQSLWGDSLRNIRGSLLDFSNRNQSLPVIDLEPYEEFTVETFIDVPLLEAAPFFVNTSEQKNTTVSTMLTLEFPAGETADEIKEIPLTFTIIEPLEEELVEEKSSLNISTTTTLIIGLSVVILVLLIFVLLTLFKRDGNGKEKNSSKHK